MTVWDGLLHCLYIFAGIVLLAGALVWYGECHPDITDKHVRRVEK